MRGTLRSRLALAGAAIMLVVAGCSTEAPVEPVPTIELAPEIIRAPLTGLPVDAPITGPALMAKIDNHPDAWPQVGLSQADIVFEELVEGGMTRYLGVWQSTIPAQLGPIRSIRPMDPAIASPFGGIIAYSGGQWAFVEAMQATPVVNAIHGESATDPFMFRADDRPGPHDVIVEAQGLVAAFNPDATMPAPAGPFAFAVDDPADATAVAAGTPTSAVDLWFSDGEQRTWTCDPASGSWLRAQNGVPDLDEQGMQLQFTNVVVVTVQIAMLDGGVPETVLEGTGDAYVFTGCSWVQATWSKSGMAEPLQLLAADGSPVLLAPGTTWVELVPAGMPVSPAQ